MKRGLREILPPLAALIWIHGLYFSLNLLLDQASRNLAEPALLAVTWAYRLSLIGGLFWLLSRLGRLIEAFLVSLSTRKTTSWDDLLLPLAARRFDSRSPFSPSSSARRRSSFHRRRPRWFVMQRASC